METRQIQKTLRIGVVSGGHIVDEFVVRPHEHVALGSGNAPRQIRYDNRRLKEGFKLFEYDTERTGYRLNLVTGMNGRVAMKDGPRDISGPLTLDVSQDERGKIVIGEQTILFQFVEYNVAAPPKPSVLDVPAPMTCDQQALILRMVAVGVPLALDSERFERVQRIAMANYRSGDRYADELLGLIVGIERRLAARISRFEKRLAQLTESDMRVFNVVMAKMAEELKMLDGRIADPNANPSALQRIVCKLERQVNKLTAELEAANSPAAKQGDSN